MSTTLDQYLAEAELRGDLTVIEIGDRARPAQHKKIHLWKADCGLSDCGFPNDLPVPEIEYQRHLKAIQP